MELVVCSLHALAVAIEIHQGHYPNYFSYDLQIHYYLEKVVELLGSDRDLLTACLQIVPHSSEHIEHVLKFV